MFPKKKTCIRCGSSFETTITSQVECNQCLIRPDISNGENGIPRIFKERICEVCTETYRPTSPAQKRCPACIALGKYVSSDTRPSEEKDADTNRKEIKKTMKNKLADLNNYLFLQMERLNDKDLSGEKLKCEIKRSKALSSIAQNIIGNAKVVLDAHIAIKEWNIDNSLPMISNGNTK